MKPGFNPKNLTTAQLTTGLNAVVDGFKMLTEHVESEFARVNQNQISLAESLADWLTEHDQSDLAHSPITRRLTKRIEMLERTCTTNATRHDS